MCDTIVINRRFSDNKQNILAKNSDRPLGECQPLCYFPTGTKRSKPDCVDSFIRYSTAPSAVLTGTGFCDGGARFAVIGSRPYWMDGFEMGANEKGLFIGNEAQGSKCSAETVEGLLGMDMLRCALEAAETAAEAVKILTGLLETFGQNANASMLFDRRYENTFIICDPKNIWLLETAGREWAAKKIQDFEAVSNCYTIGDDWDICSENMIRTVRENRWLNPKEPVSFAKAYTKPAIRQRFSVPRRERMMKLLLNGLHFSMDEKSRRRFDEDIENGTLFSDRDIRNALKSCKAAAGEQLLKNILCDHFDGEINSGRFSDTCGENCSICMHANTRDEAKTAASMIMTCEKGIGLKLLWAPASPCMSIYIPVYWIPGQTPSIPECMSKGSGTFDRASLWWNTEWAGQLSGMDEDIFFDDNAADLESVDAYLSEKLPAAEKQARKLIKEERPAEAQAVLDELTAVFASEALKAAENINLYMISELKREGGFYGPGKEFLEEYAGMVSLFENI